MKDGMAVESKVVDVCELVLINKPHNELGEILGVPDLLFLKLEESG